MYKETDWDKYFNTDDGYLNKHTYRWADTLYARYLNDYFERKKGRTWDLEGLIKYGYKASIGFNDYFAVMAEAMQKLYFFIVREKAGPFAVGKKVEEIAEDFYFDKELILHILDWINRLLHYIESPERFEIVRDYLLKYREHLLPFDEDSKHIERTKEFRAKVTQYTFGHLKATIAELDGPIKKIAYLRWIVLKLQRDEANGVLNEYETDLSNKNNFCKRVKLELESLLEQVDSKYKGTEWNSQSSAKITEFSGIEVVPEKRDELFNSISHKFPEKDHLKLKSLLKGCRVEGRVFFNGKASQLALIFGQLWDNNFVNAKDTKSIDSWLSEYFLFSAGINKMANYKANGKAYRILLGGGMVENPVVKIQNGTIKAY